MKITHRYIFESKRKVVQALARAGFSSDDFTNIGFNLNELSCEQSDRRWPAIQKLAVEYEMMVQAETIFSENEIRSAAWCALWSNRERHYPQPENDFGYLDRTFVKRRFCADCGIGLRQKAPFFIRGSTSNSTSAAFKLFWEPFHIFVSRVVWERCFEPFGIEFHEVRSIRDKAAIPGLLQLRVDKLAHVDAGGIPADVCRTCGRKKHEFYFSGRFPKVVRQHRHKAFTTSEIFGSGAIAGRYIVVNREIANALLTNRVKGVVLTPCEESNAAGSDPANSP